MINKLTSIASLKNNRLLFSEIAANQHLLDCFFRVRNKKVIDVRKAEFVIADKVQL